MGTRPVLGLQNKMTGFFLWDALFEQPASDNTTGAPVDHPKPRVSFPVHPKKFLFFAKGGFLPGRIERPERIVWERFGIPLKLGNNSGGGMKPEKFGPP